MAKRFYPAVLERCPKKTFAVWFPDFPGCVAAGLSQEQALEKAEQELAAAMEREQPLPTPSPFERVEIPQDCDVITLCVIGAEAPDASERVNVYLSKSLLERADRKAAEMGMNRSSFFGFALSSVLPPLNPGPWKSIPPKPASAFSSRKIGATGAPIRKGTKRK